MILVILLTLAVCLTALYGIGSLLVKISSAKGMDLPRTRKVLSYMKPLVDVFLAAFGFALHWLIKGLQFLLEYIKRDPNDSDHLHSPESLDKRNKS